MKQDEETTRLSTLLATPMGKVMSSGGPEYTPEEVVTMQAADAQAEIPAEQVLVQQVAELNDPNAPDQTKDEWRRRTQLKKSLQEQGLLDSDFMATTKGVGGLVMTIADGVTSPLRYDPRDENGNVIPSEGALEYISRYNPATWPAAQADAALRLPATLNYAGELLEQGYGIMSDGLAGMGGPRYKVKETGDFITEMDRAMYRTKVAQTGGLAGDPSDDALIKQYAAQGMTLEPVTPEDVEEFEYQQHLRFRGRLKSMEQKRTEGAGAEVLTAAAMSLSAAPLDWMTGSNYMDQVWGKKLPAESQAMAMQMGADPMVWTSFGAGLTRLGVSTAAKGGGARILDAIGKGAQKMARPTEQSLREVQRFQNAVWSKGRVALYAGGLAGMNYSSLPEPLKNAMNVAAAAYVIHKGGAGTLRWVGDKFPQAAIMLREAADPLNGADIMARQAIAKNTKIPANIRERVAKPSQFVSMESTPARLARNEALSPKTRKMMERLSNFYVVQGVRGASAVATGATKGVIAAAPFAELTRGGGDEEGANLIYGAGTALGGTGGAASRVFGARNRTVARAESDIGRMLVDIQGAVPELQRQGAVKRNQWFDRELNRFLTDVELAGGDIAHMFQARSFDEIARTAAMQGMFRNVDYVPLNDTDFALNAKAHGQSGAAGFYLHNPDGARPRLFVNLDARRADVDAHEFGEAFFSSDAFSPEQKAAMRAEVDARYGAEGVTARAREYAEQMIKSENARNFPNETLVVSDEQIRAKMDELAQDELGRGGQDPADWARREIMVEEWRMAGTDYARLRRGVPAGANPVTFVENILGANARALGLSGVRIDPETGQAVTPDQLFKENPVAADDPIVNRNLRAYIKTYNAWLNDPSQEAPSGVKVARDGNVQSFANNPNVDFYSSDPDNPSAPRENTFAVLGPDGRVIEKSPKQRRDERKARNTQVKNMAGRNLLAPGDAAFGLKRRADGRVVASGRRLPQSIILQNHWKPWLPIINTLETLADSGESVQVRYFAAGNSADKVKTAKPTDVVAINREMVFDQWTTNKDGDLLAQFLDLTSMRNRAMRAIGERNPALDPANGGPGYSLQAIMDDVNQWMADKRAGKAGEATIGPDRKNIVNALINPGTAVNRGKNPLAGSMGKGSAIKTLILEGINAVSGTGRKGAAMDYNWANGNFMPDQPPPRPDVDIDLPQERMPSALPQTGMAMPDGPVRGERADIPLNPRARQAAFISDRGEVRATGRATHFETNEDLGPDFLAIGAGHLGEDGFFRFGSQSMDEAMGDSPATSSAAAARYNQSVYDQGQRPSSMLEEPPGLERPAMRGQAMADVGSPENQPKAAPTDQQTMIQRNPAGDYEPLGMLRKQPNGKWAVYTAPMMATNKDGTQTMLPPSKLAEYPNEAKARARAEKEFFTSLPLQDAKQYLGPREQKAITEAQRRIAEVAKNNPEAARLEVTRDDRGLPKVGLIEDADGNPVLDARGNQKFGAIYRKAQYDLRKAPGLSKDEARAVQQAADLMEADARRGQANPAIAKGIGWYGRMRGWLQQAYGATIEMFGQLLGATSARTPVDTNFIQAREALQIFGRGGYDDLLGRFDAFVMQKKADADSGKMEADWRKRGGKGTFKLQDEYRKQVNSFKEVPLRANGKKYNANSTKVLHALYGNWIAQTKGPKTPNFAGNLTGRTFKATIDVWAARNLRRLLYQGKSKRWRILPEQEQGVADVDFFFGQKVYDEVGRRMGIPTDDLQALQWFNEKDIWETNDWTDKTGAEKSSFDKEAGKLNLDRYQVGLTTFQDAGNFDPAVQRAELAAFRNIVRAQDGLEAARVTESEGLYGNVIEPTFDAEFSVNRKGEVSPSIEPIIRQAIDTANRNRQNDVFISAVVDETHPNARPMVEVGFKSAASRAEVEAVTAVFRSAGIDGFTVARNERGDVLGIRAQYVPEISARYDALGHLDPDQFAVRADKWMDVARNAIASLENQDNVSYRKEGHVSTNVYGIEEYGSVTPADILRSSSRQELGRRRAILAAGTR